MLAHEEKVNLVKLGGHLRYHHDTLPRCVTNVLYDCEGLLHIITNLPNIGSDFPQADRIINLARDLRAADMRKQMTTI